MNPPLLSFTLLRTWHRQWLTAQYVKGSAKTRTDPVKCVHHCWFPSRHYRIASCQQYLPEALGGFPEISHCQMTFNGVHFSHWFACFQISWIKFSPINIKGHEQSLQILGPLKCETTILTFHGMIAKCSEFPQCYNENFGLIHLVRQSAWICYPSLSVAVGTWFVSCSSRIRRRVPYRGC